MASSRILTITITSILMGALYSGLVRVEAQCVPSRGCTALAFYNISFNEQLNKLYSNFGTNLQSLREYNDIPNEDFVAQGSPIYIPFQCSCNNGRLSHNFTFSNVNDSDTTASINRAQYYGLSKPELMVSPVGSQIFPGQPVFVPVNCSCGNPEFPNFGLFVTYPVQPNDTKELLARNFNVTLTDLGRYNPSVNLDALSTDDDRLFIPKSLPNGTYLPFRGDEGSGSSNTGVIVGVVVGVLVALVVAGAASFWLYRRKRRAKVELSHSNLEFGAPSAETKQGGFLFGSNGAGNNVLVPAALSDFAVDKSVEFSYEELAAVTDNFSIANKIGEGGYGAVYYGELRNQKLAIKKMNMQASREFMSELKVLTHVHHTNLVQLIGFCTVESLFLVYEYIDNGTLAQHLRGSGSRLSWSQRIQIALDAARGLEYIHEHTKPTYIHRDVKSPNILIDKNFRAKVADFGLTKLTESAPGGSASLTQPTRLVGTFGYMPPEYARFGDVSPKIDVYSFGVVLYEIVSAKDAIVRVTDVDDSVTNASDKVAARGLVTLFDGVLKAPDATQKLKTLIDPALGTSYPFESVWKLAKLAEACTQETPDNRPNMRAVVVALMTLCTSTTELDSTSSDSHIYGLMTGR